MAEQKQSLLSKSTITAYETEYKSEHLEITEEKYQSRVDSINSVLYKNEDTDSDESSSDEHNIGLSKREKIKKRRKTADPFIPRDLKIELYEVINSFDMVKYGENMAQLVINEIKEEFDMEQLWTILTIIMEGMPFSMALEILNREVDTLKKGKPERMESLCLHMVDGTNWRVSSALRMAQYFENISVHDKGDFQYDEWMNISQNFENIA
eukprot:400922_1